MPPRRLIVATHVAAGRLRKSAAETEDQSDREPDGQLAESETRRWTSWHESLGWQMVSPRPR